MALTGNETTGNDRTAAATAAPTQASGVIRTALHKPEPVTPPRPSGITAMSQLVAVPSTSPQVLGPEGSVQLAQRWRRNRSHQEGGLLRVVGVRPRQLCRTIRYESTVIALIGTIVGLALGLFLGDAAPERSTSSMPSPAIEPALQERRDRLPIPVVTHIERLITVTRTPTNHRPTSGAVKERVGPPSAARRPRPPHACTSNPLRVGRIGVDHIQVFIRPAHGPNELLALVERLEQLIDAGYDTIDVVFESSTRELSAARDEPFAVAAR
ncbi:MAG: FtsX-like permease family protein [Ilumatobacteraceae bacterium]